MASGRLQSIGLHFPENAPLSKLEEISLSYSDGPLEDGPHERRHRGSDWKSNARTDVLAGVLAILKLRDSPGDSPGRGSLESVRDDAEADLCARFHDLWHSPRKRLESHWLDAVFDRETRELASPLAVLLAKSGGRKSLTVRLAAGWTGVSISFFRGDSPLPRTELVRFVEERFSVSDLESRPAVAKLPRRYRTSFVGRDDDLAQLTSLESEHHFTTLVGPSGVGKTRLAREYVDRLSDRAVYWVDLSAASAGDDVAECVAQAVGRSNVDPHAGIFAISAVTQILAEQSAVLVLDNCELALTDVRELSEQLLEGADGVRILATSTESIGVHGETCLLIRPFVVSDTVSESAQALECVRLFTHRANAAGASFSTTGLGREELVAILAVCRAVGGLPLGIELAAAAARQFPLRDLAGFLVSNTAEVRSADRSVPDRHETLFSVLSWTFQTLTETQRSLCLSLSAFPFDWSLARVVSILHRIGISEAEVTLAHARLTDLSMVRSESRGRYSMLPPVRNFATARMANPVDAEARAYLGFLNAFEEEYLVLLQPPILEVSHASTSHPGSTFENSARVQAEELRNCRAAAQLALENGRQERAVRFVEALFPLWISAGQWREGSAFCRSLLGIENLSHPDRARVLWVTGGLEFRLGNITAARSSYTAARDLAEAEGVTTVLPHALHGLGAIAFRTAKLEEAEDYFDQAVQLWSAKEDRNQALLALNNLAAVAATRGQFDVGAERFAAVIERAAELGDERTLASGLQNLGLMRWRVNAPEEARQLLERSLDIWTGLGDGWGQSMSANTLAALAHAEGDFDSARSFYRQSLILRKELEDLAGIAASLEGIAELARSEKDPDCCLQFLAVAHSIRQKNEIGLMEENREQVDRCKAWAEQCLAGTKVQTARQLGSALHWREAVELALDSLSD